MKKILLLLISLILISCSDDSDENVGLIFDQNAFLENRQLWEENGISNYTFSQEYFSLSVGGQPKIKSIIINGELDSIFIQSINVNNLPVEEFIHYETVDDIFQFIEWSTGYSQDLINSNQSTLISVEYDITYDETYHYPTKISFKGRHSEPMLGGLSVDIILSDFKIPQ